MRKVNPRAWYAQFLTAHDFEDDMPMKKFLEPHDILFLVRAAKIMFDRVFDDPSCVPDMTYGEFIEAIEKG